MIELENWPTGKYRVVVIDPPWPIGRTVHGPYSPGYERRKPYEQMSLEQIFALPIADLLHKDALVYLWAIHSKVPAAIDMLARWGLQFSCIMTWHKNKNTFPIIYRPMYNSEHIVHGYIGRPSFKTRQRYMACFNGKARRHSQKPDEFYSMLRRSTYGPRIDLFARKAHHGFAGWGNEYEGS